MTLFVTDEQEEQQEQELGILGVRYAVIMRRERYFEK